MEVPFFLQRIETTQRMEKFQKTKSKFQTCPPTSVKKLKANISTDKPSSDQQRRVYLEFKDRELELI